MPDAAPLRSNDPESLGGYRVVGRLGEGGQGVVYLGEPESGDPVAIKLLHAQFTADPKARRSFAKELAAAQQVDPFCTARILAADVEGDVPYIVSELINGPSLREVVKSDGPRAGSALNRLAIGTATALTAIHRAGVVHRDFKPSNVLLGPDGPRVIDFGVARASGTGTTVTTQSMGTPAYMAPEQFAGTRPGPAADVFAWGCTMVYAATGTPPFGQDFIPAIMNRTLHEEPELGALEGPLRELVTACLNKDPDRRPTSQQVLLRLLGHDEAVVAEPVAALAAPGTAEMLEEGVHLAGAAETLPPSGQRPAQPSGVLKSGVIATVAAFVAAAVVAGLMFWLYAAERKPPATGRAAEQVSSSPSSTGTPTSPSPGKPSQSPVVSGGNLSWFAGRLGLPLKKGWRKVTVGDTDYVLTEPCAKRSEPWSCGFIVLGPDGVAQANEMRPYRLDQPYHPSTDIGMCPDDAKLVQRPVHEKPMVDTAPVGDRRAHFRGWQIDCGRENSDKVDHTVSQREWYLPDSKILIVDWRETPGIEGVLSGASWR